MTPSPSDGPYGAVLQPTGLVILPSGTEIMRAHPRGKSPSYYGPAVGSMGSNRFDVIGPRTNEQSGVLYSAFTMLGVLHEVVWRNNPLPSVSRAAESRRRSLSLGRLTRDVVLIDLWLNLNAHGLQLGEITEPPKANVPTPYPYPQVLATKWEAETRMGRWPDPPGALVDGIAYSSRFGAMSACLAIWERAADAIDWVKEEPLGDHAEFAVAARSLGIEVLP